ncbi:MAG: hypothetical protein CMG20_02655, partial [Candidatus Marinimicrobia bacterium]|nr:hypothetical protein [Candidatus Neomarinimicrobiota bacterium]
MNKFNNPYATALDGLILNDPVSAFFDFCREREEIRLARESGAPHPWTDDPIFQQARFLNVFREDDRSSKAILSFAKDLEKDLPMLIHALFFARWCNRQETLDELSSDILSRPEKLLKKLKSFEPWCNLTAYPVESIHWEGTQHSRLDAATTLFGDIKESLAKIIIEAQGDVIKATNAVNALFKMQNDFPIFMAIIDLAWFRPDVIHPTSHVPTGIGAVAYLDRLQTHFGLNNHQQTCDRMIALQKEYWPEAKRAFQP